MCISPLCPSLKKNMGQFITTTTRRLKRSSMNARVIRSFDNSTEGMRSVICRLPTKCRTSFLPFFSIAEPASASNSVVVLLPLISIDATILRLRKTSKKQPNMTRSITQRSREVVVDDAEAKQGRSGKRQISFKLEDNTVKTIPHVNDLSEQEIGAIWYDRSEMDQIKMGLIPDIRRMMRGETLEETASQTARGIEFRTKQGALYRQRNKQTAIRAVLDEQERQKKEGISDDALLAGIYCSCSSHCKDSAHNFGMNDELAALQAAASIPNLEPAPMHKSHSGGVAMKQVRKLSQFLRSTNILAEPLRSLSNMDRRVIGSTAA